VKSAPHPLVLLIVFWADRVTGLSVVKNWMIDNLALSPYDVSHPNPIGIVGSVFIYDGWLNTVFLALTVLAFYLLAIYFMACPQTGITRSTIRRLSIVFSASSIAAAIVANAIWYFSPTALQSYGTSGVVAGAAGSLAAIGIILVVIPKIKSSFLRQLHQMTKREFGSSATSHHDCPAVANIVATIAWALWTVTLIAVFWSFATREAATQYGSINLSVHWYSFFSGIIAAGISILFLNEPHGAVRASGSRRTPA
jgi:hypothetical protein